MEINSLIGVSGSINSGKDFVGKILTYIDYADKPTYNGFENEVILDSPYEIKKCADKLKDCVCLIIGCTREQLEDEVFKNKELSEEWWLYERTVGIRTEIITQLEYDKLSASQKIRRKLIKLTPRMMLQLLGTQAGRMIIHPNIWVSALFSDFDGEIWINIEDYENSYQISNYGNVRSLNRTITYGSQKGEYHTKSGQILTPTKSGNYYTVSLSGKTFTVHYLVAKHFCDGYKDGYVINHKDFDTSNNYWKNLEWVTQSDNVKHNKKYLRGAFGENQKDSKLTDETALMIKILLREKQLKQNDIAKQFGVSPTTITDIKKGRKWGHVGKSIPIITAIYPPKWIITDVRFPENEGIEVTKRNGLLIGLRRKFALKHPEYAYLINDGRDEYEIPHELEKLDNKLYKSLVHESEISMGDHSWCDVIIENNGTKEELFNKVLSAVTIKK